MTTPLRGRADYFKPGEWNVACSMCGRKRKSSEVVRNWQGLYRCPEHNEPRQPQDFARGVKDVMTVPFAQPETDLFVTVNATFPASVTPTSVTLGTNAFEFITDSTNNYIETELGLILTNESGFIGSVQVLLPNWVTAASYAWSWQTGGANITIDNPTGEATDFLGTSGATGGTAQCVITSTLGAVATVYVVVTVSG